MRKIIMTFLVLITFLLQTTVCPYIRLASVMPNLPIVLIISFGFMRGKKEGLLTGFFLGLLFDIFYCSFPGYYALIYMCIGYLSGTFHHLFFDFEIKLPLMITAICDLLYGSIVCFFSFVLQGKFNLLFYVTRLLIPEMFYTLAFTLLFYWFFHWMNEKLEMREKRSVNDVTI